MLTHILQHFQRVVEIVLMRPSVTLFYDVERSQFGQDDVHQSATLQQFQTDTGMWCHHDLVQFHLNTLAADDLDAVGHALQSFKRLVFDLEVQLGGKADTTHHAQRVVAERHLWVKWGGYDTILQVGNTIKWVHQLTEASLVQTDSHRIDGEVATVLVVLQRAVLNYRLARIVAVALLTCPHELHLLLAVLHLCCTEILKNAQVGMLA